MREVTVICGLQGTGKTTVARLIAEQQEAVLLRTDVVRKELFDEPKYTIGEMQQVYEEMFARACQEVLDKNVVLDATFSKQVNRQRARDIARDVGATFQIIEVTSESEVINERLEARNQDASEADWNVYQNTIDDFEPIQEPGITIDNSGSKNDLIVKLSSLTLCSE